MSNPAQKPMTRGKLAKFLCTNTKFLGRFIQKENIEVPSRALLTPKIIREIIKKFNGQGEVGTRWAKMGQNGTRIFFETIVFVD